MPEWIGSVLFLGAVGLSGSKIAEDFGMVEAWSGARAAPKAWPLFAQEGV